MKTIQLTGTEKQAAQTAIDCDREIAEYFAPGEPQDFAYIVEDTLYVPDGIAETQLIHHLEEIENGDEIIKRL